MANKKNFELKYIVVDGENHVADNAVCRYIDSLENQLAEEQVKHQKFIESISADIDLQAQRVAINLASGMQSADNCLKHSLSYFDKTDPVTGEPIFSFQTEVLRRIVLALAGKTATGNAYTK